MVAETVGGLIFGSIVLVADGLHMSTHAGALLLAALAYTYARKHAVDPNFTFGTSKLGDLAGFTSRHRSRDDSAADRLRVAKEDAGIAVADVPHIDEFLRADRLRLDAHSVAEGAEGVWKSEKQVAVGVGRQITMSPSAGRTSISSTVSCARP